MDISLYDEMRGSDCWEGGVVFSARGFKFDILPNPVFGVFPSDCPRHKAALFFTPRQVSLMVQTSPDDANIAVEDGLDTISAIIEHHLPESKESPSAVCVTVLEFRCLHNRFYFGVTPAVAAVTTTGDGDYDDDGTSYDPLASPLGTAVNQNSAAPAAILKTFEALPSILQVYSPGLSYDRLVPHNPLAEAVSGQDFPEGSAPGDFGWTPPPPSESPPSTRRSASTSKRRGHGESSTGKKTNDGDNSLEGTSDDEDDDHDGNSDSSASSSSGGYSNMMTSGKGANNNGYSSFATRRLDLLGGAELVEKQQQLSDLQVLEAEDRCDLVMEQMGVGFFDLCFQMQKSCDKIAKSKIDAVHTIHTSTLNAKHSFATYDGEDGLALPIPVSAKEEPGSDVVRNFLEEMEKSVRVRLGSYLVSGSGPQVLAQRQQAESAVMYRSLSEQLERLKSQNSALAVQLAQERRHIEDLETETEEARHEAGQARAREQAIVSRMRRREAEFAAASGQQMQVDLNGDDDD